MHEEETPPLLLKVEDVARLLSLGRSTVYNLINSGEIPTVTVGGILRVPMTALTNMIENRTTYKGVTDE